MGIKWKNKKLLTIKCTGCSKEHFDIKELEKIKYINESEDTRFELRCRNCGSVSFYLFLEDD